MALDLRPRYNIPSDAYDMPDPVASALQAGMGGFDKGYAAGDSLRKRRLKELQVAALIQNRPELQGIVSADNVDALMPELLKNQDKNLIDTPYGKMAPQQYAGFLEKDKHDQLMADQQDRRLEALQAQFTEKLKMMSDQMGQNRLARLATSQNSQDLQSDKFDISNLFKTFSGYKTKAGDIVDRFRSLGGTTPGSGQTEQTKVLDGKTYVKVNGQWHLKK